jgi:hypothetical protein
LGTETESTVSLWQINLFPVGVMTHPRLDRNKKDRGQKKPTFRRIYHIQNIRVSIPPVADEQIILLQLEFDPRNLDFYRELVQYIMTFCSKNFSAAMKFRGAL